jgi:hypothetical protein
MLKHKYTYPELNAYKKGYAKGYRAGLKRGRLGEMRDWVKEINEWHKHEQTGLEDK